MGIGDPKGLQLLSVLVRNPAEFLERSRLIAERKLSLFDPPKPMYAVSDWESVVEQLSELTGCRFKGALNGAQLSDLSSCLRKRMESLPAEAPFGKFHNGDTVLAELCFAVVRAMRPKRVVETGVCYGVTSAHLLAALEGNAEGHLYSIDLPPLGRDGDGYVGWLVPEELRRRWTLERGTSHRLLGPMLKKIGSIDLFVHDSLHTYKNMKMEFEVAWSHLSPGGMLIADDIEGNAAFQEFAGRSDVVFHGVVRERNKHSLAGILTKAMRNG